MSDFVCAFVPSICKPTPAVLGTKDEPADLNNLSAAIFTPEVPAKYIGKIMLKPMAYEERLDIIETSMMGAEGGDENTKNMSLISFSKEFARNKLKDFFVSSTLTRVEDNYLFDTLDKLKLDGPASSCIPEMSMAIISGQLSLGK